MREALFLQLLFLLDSRQRLGVRLRVLSGDSEGHCTIFYTLYTDGVDVGKLGAAVRCGFERELAFTAGRVNAHTCNPVPGPVPLVKIEEDAAPLPFAAERSQRSFRFD